MRHCLIFFVLLTAACTEKERIVYQPTYVPADLMVPCLTPTPPAETEGEHARNDRTVWQDRACANDKLRSISLILTP